MYLFHCFTQFMCWKGNQWVRWRAWLTRRVARHNNCYEPIYLIFADFYTLEFALPTCFSIKLAFPPFFSKSSFPPQRNFAVLPSRQAKGLRHLRQCGHCLFEPTESPCLIKGAIRNYQFTINRLSQITMTNVSLLIELSSEICLLSNRTIKAKPNKQFLTQPLDG